MNEKPSFDFTINESVEKLASKFESVLNLEEKADILKDSSRKYSKVTITGRRRRKNIDYCAPREAIKRRHPSDDIYPLDSSEARPEEFFYSNSSIDVAHRNEKGVCRNNINFINNMDEENLDKLFQIMDKPCDSTEIRSTLGMNTEFTGKSKFEFQDNKESLNENKEAEVFQLNTKEEKNNTKSVATETFNAIIDDSLIDICISRESLQQIHQITTLVRHAFPSSNSIQYIDKHDTISEEYFQSYYLFKKLVETLQYALFSDSNKSKYLPEITEYNIENPFDSFETNIFFKDGSTKNKNPLTNGELPKITDETLEVINTENIETFLDKLENNIEISNNEESFKTILNSIENSKISDNIDMEIINKDDDVQSILNFPVEILEENNIKNINEDEVDQNKIKEPIIKSLIISNPEKNTEKNIGITNIKGGCTEAFVKHFSLPPTTSENTNLDLIFDADKTNKKNNKKNKSEILFHKTLANNDCKLSIMHPFGLIEIKIAENHGKISHEVNKTENNINNFVRSNETNIVLDCKASSHPKKNNAIKCLDMTGLSKKARKKLKKQFIKSDLLFGTEDENIKHKAQKELPANTSGVKIDTNLENKIGGQISDTKSLHDKIILKNDDNETLDNIEFQNVVSLKKCDKTAEASEQTEMLISSDEIKTYITEQPIKPKNDLDMTKMSKNVRKKMKKRFKKSKLLLEMQNNEIQNKVQENLPEKHTDKIKSKLPAMKKNHENISHENEINVLLDNKEGTLQNQFSENTIVANISKGNVGIQNVKHVSNTIETFVSNKRSVSMDTKMNNILEPSFETIVSSDILNTKTNCQNFEQENICQVIEQIQSLNQLDKSESTMTMFRKDLKRVKNQPKRSLSLNTYGKKIIPDAKEELSLSKFTFNSDTNIVMSEFNTAKNTVGLQNRITLYDKNVIINQNNKTSDSINRIENVELSINGLSDVSEPAVMLISSETNKSIMYEQTQPNKCLDNLETTRTSKNVHKKMKKTSKKTNISLHKQNKIILSNVQEKIKENTGGMKSDPIQEMKIDKHISKKNSSNLNVYQNKNIFNTEESKKMEREIFVLPQAQTSVTTVNSNGRKTYDKQLVSETCSKIDNSKSMMVMSRKDRKKLQKQMNKKSLLSKCKNELPSSTTTISTNDTIQEKKTSSPIIYDNGNGTVYCDKNISLTEIPDEKEMRKMSEDSTLALCAASAKSINYDKAKSSNEVNNNENIIYQSFSDLRVKLISSLARDNDKVGNSKNNISKDITLNNESYIETVEAVNTTLLNINPNSTQYINNIILNKESGEEDIIKQTQRAIKTTDQKIESTVEQNVQNSNKHSESIKIESQKTLGEINAQEKILLLSTTEQNCSTVNITLNTDKYVLEDSNQYNTKRIEVDTSSDKHPSNTKETEHGDTTINSISNNKLKHLDGEFAAINESLLESYLIFNEDLSEYSINKVNILKNTTEISQRISQELQPSNNDIYYTQNIPSVSPNNLVLNYTGNVDKQECTSQQTIKIANDTDSCKYICDEEVIFEEPTNTNELSREKLLSITKVLYNTLEDANELANKELLLEEICPYCGEVAHRKSNCPAFRAQCIRCNRTGHFISMCDTPHFINTTKIENSKLLWTSNLIPLKLNEIYATGLIVSESPFSYIDSKFAYSLNLQISSNDSFFDFGDIGVEVIGICSAELKCQQKDYVMSFFVINNLCADVVLGRDISLLLNNDLGCIEPVSLFTYLAHNVKPIVGTPRRFTVKEENFINSEINRLLQSGIIEHSTSPWKSQIMIICNSNNKRQLFIDYSETINIYTELDTYDLPDLGKFLDKLEKFGYYTVVNLQDCLNQIPIEFSQRKYTAFEANGVQYQFTCIPYGVVNGIIAFHRAMERIINTEELEGAHAFLDIVVITGDKKESHDLNMEKFKLVTRKYGLIINKSNYGKSSDRVMIYGNLVMQNIVRFSKDRMSPLLELPIPCDYSDLKRDLNIFRHYERWIQNFESKIHPFKQNNIVFPLNEDLRLQYECLRKEAAHSSLIPIDNKDLLVVQTDLSLDMMTATLSQKCCPKSFYFRKVKSNEVRYSNIEREIITLNEALMFWKYYLVGRHFLIITDNECVEKLFTQCTSDRVENRNIDKWRVEVQFLKYDIIVLPDKER